MARDHHAHALASLGVPVLHVADRAQLIAELTARNPGIADLLMDLEADDELRAKLEIELLGG